MFQIKYLEIYDKTASFIQGPESKWIVSASQGSSAGIIEMIIGVLLLL